VKHSMKFRNPILGMGLLWICSLLVAASPLLGCNSFSHQWSLVGLEENSNIFPWLAAEELFHTLPAQLASASRDIPWLQNASSVLLLAINTATDSWVFQNAPRSGTSQSSGICIQASPSSSDTMSVSIPFAGGEGMSILPRLNSSPLSSDSYEFLQIQAAKSGLPAASIEVVSGYQSVSHFVDLLPIRLGTVRSQCFQRIEVLLRLADHQGNILLVGPLKAEVTLSTDTRISLGLSYIGRFERRIGDGLAWLNDLSGSFPAQNPLTSSGIATPTESPR